LVRDCKDPGELAGIRGMNKSPMKIAFVIPYFYPAWEYGGQPRSAYELARALVQRGHHVHVLTTDSGGHNRLPIPPLKCWRDIVSGIEVLYYRNVSNRLAFHQRVFWSPPLFRDLRRQIAGMDIVHIHELRSTVTIAGYSAARKCGVPYVVSTHGGLRHLGRKILKVAFDKIWGQRILNNASYVVAVSPAERTDAIQAGVETERIRLLPNAIEISDYANLPERGTFKKAFGLQSSRMILFLGRLHWIKGADLLIRAFTRTARLYEDIHLVIAGPDDGQETSLRSLAIENGIENRVTFTGTLDHTGKLQALRDAALTVVPSRSEVFALTAVEAMLCGSPVLLSSICRLDPLPSEEDGVMTFQSEDVDDLAAKLSLMISNDGFRERIQRGRNLVAREFGSRKIGQLAEGIYEDAIRRH
jgi:glycosyltransferase involved in cell wall biosynthesis